MTMDTVLFIIMFLLTASGTRCGHMSIIHLAANQKLHVTA